MPEGPVAGRDDKRFTIIGENVHTTRIVRRPGPLIQLAEDGRESIRFTDESGDVRLLPIPDEEKRTQEYEEGRVKHVRSAVRLAMGDGPDREVGLTYLRALALRQVVAGAAFLDVNVDEYSHRLPEQIETMRWLVEELAPLAGVPLSIDSSNLDIIRSGMQAAGTHAGPPMLNSASLERAEALELAARTGGAVIVTASGAAAMPAGAGERVANASLMVERAFSLGIPADLIYVDPLVFPISVDGTFGAHCLDAIRELRARFGPDVHITGGFSNVSFGIPQRRLINDAFLVLAIEAGADSGIIDPVSTDLDRVMTIDLEHGAYAMACDAILGRDENCRAFLRAYRAGDFAEHGVVPAARRAS
jgi:5-methyltetrahydrofolate corrinoid/iron sulfur protein methyltransferase